MQCRNLAKRLVQTITINWFCFLRSVSLRSTILRRHFASSIAFRITVIVFQHHGIFNCRNRIQGRQLLLLRTLSAHRDACAGPKLLLQEESCRQHCRRRSQQNFRQQCFRQHLRHNCSSSCPRLKEIGSEINGGTRLVTNLFAKLFVTMQLKKTLG